MKIMAIDYGDAHTGIAVSDALLTAYIKTQSSIYGNTFSHFKP